MYTVEAAGVTAPNTGVGRFPPADAPPGGLMSQTMSAPVLTKNASARQGAASMFASITGGRLIRNTNDLTEGVKEAADDLRGTYSIGFYVPNEPATNERDDRWREFKVETKRTGVKLLQRQGYILRTPASGPQEWTPDEWQQAVASPVTSTAIRLDVRAEMAGGKMRTVLQIASDDLQFQEVDNRPQTDLDVTLAERTAEGWTRIRTDQATLTIGQSKTADLSSTLTRFPKEWTINPNTTAVRVVVRDRATGRYGSLDIPLANLRLQERD
jgi:hypothetical protein